MPQSAAPDKTFDYGSFVARGRDCRENVSACCQDGRRSDRETDRATGPRQNYFRCMTLGIPRFFTVCVIKMKDSELWVLTGQRGLNIYATHRRRAYRSSPVCVSSNSRDKPGLPGEPLAVVSSEKRATGTMFCRLFFDNLDERKRNVVGDVLAWHPKPSGQDAEKRHWRSTFQKTHHYCGTGGNISFAM